MSYNITDGDQELLQLLQGGSREAYLQVYKKYQRLLFLYAFRKLNNQEEAEDVVQEVFISFWDKCSKLSAEVSIAGYLYRAVRNRALNIFAHREIENKYLESLDTFLESNYESADTLIRERQIRALITAEIERLPPKMREIFELSRNGHLSYKEIALELDISEYTVGTQIKRALKVLRTKLGACIFLHLFF
ncbi:RNA polymerase sigma factor [Pedobacter gandavensis]|uniref:RNA polymerase sigma-70 factor n=1 Tax=Pedobacter gandavensis TaxID=2679963 RepID=A0ABR6ETF4_9SPHI|nr:RNA polymerase sigma-70 factor [Pedobacter gandavensis]MBB2148332.1 RNA polymerase sigma-70 factor [Pedobacter gandavensis]